MMFMTNIEIIFIKSEYSKNTCFGPFETCKDIYKALSTKHSVRITICTNQFDLKNVVTRNPDLVILTNKVVTDTCGRPLWLADFFEKHGINYTGSNVESLKLDSDKISSKLQVKSQGIRTARFFTAVPGQYNNPEDIPIPFPLFIKPNNTANSDGVDKDSCAVSFASFKKKIAELFLIYKKPLLVEEYLSGREFTVSIIDSKVRSIAPVEIIPPINNNIRILSKKVKDDDSETLREVTDKKTCKQLSSLAIASFMALKARDFGRIDIKMDSHGNCYFMEANLTPGMKKTSSYFPVSYSLSSTLKYDVIINRIIQAAIDRKNNTSNRLEAKI